MAATHESASNSPSFSEQTGKVAEDVRELGHIAMDSAGRAVRSARERGSRSLEHGRDRVEAAGRGLGSFVMENPMPAVLIGVGIGALFALLLRGRS
jgi:ElaB/YqjD/DUF883 family membrane-anchored ribosome-binding protein